MPRGGASGNICCARPACKPGQGAEPGRWRDAMQRSAAQPPIDCRKPCTSAPAPAADCSGELASWMAQHGWKWVPPSETGEDAQVSRAGPTPGAAPTPVPLLLKGRVRSRTETKIVLVCGAGKG